jgi:hypothetical protein
MFRAMAWKELRETLWIVLLILAAFALTCCGSLRSALDWDFLPSFSAGSANYIPFVEDSFFGGRFWWLCAAATLALGLRQSLGESRHHTYPFLLHRPASRCWLIGMKLFVGLGIYLTAGASLILLYGHWAATPGKHASPFEWSMTVPTWTTMFAMTSLYLGAFLTGIRPARWFGTRLMPLLATVPMLLVAFADVSPWFNVLVLVADAWLIATILFVARSRDYA